MEMSPVSPPDRLPSVFSVGLVQIMAGAAMFVALLKEDFSFVLLSGIVLILFGGARVWTRSSTAHLRCRSNLDKTGVFPGETVTLFLEVENVKLLPIRIEIRHPYGIAGSDSPLSETASRSSVLFWYQRVRFQDNIQGLRRGWYKIGPPLLKTGDLFGFFDRSIRFSDSIGLAVYPRPARVIRNPLPRRDLFGKPQRHGLVPDPVNLVGTREYRPDHPARFIHWKASARHAHLQEKIFDPAVQTKILFVLDVSSFTENSASEAFEDVLEVLAGLVLYYYRRGHSMGWITDGEMAGNGSRMLPISGGPDSSRLILEAMARVTRKPTRSLSALMQNAGVISYGTSCIYAFGDSEHLRPENWEFFRQRRIPMVLIRSALLPADEDIHRFPGPVFHRKDLVSTKGDTHGR